MDKTSTETSDPSVQTSNQKDTTATPDATPANAPTQTAVAASPDAALPDAASPDAASPDAASPDAASPDAASPDAASPDAASPDAASPDAASPDAASPDAASPDAASPDAASPDAAATSPNAGEASKKKKKRRRRKKKKSSAGQEVAPENKQAQVPFLHLFEGPKGMGRDHAFSAGEIVAGRVAEVRDVSIFVDLFGKATAVMDLWEPREVPPQPAPEERNADPSSVQAAAPGQEPDIPADAAQNNQAAEPTSPSATEALPPAGAATLPQGAPGDQVTREVPVAELSAGVTEADSDNSGVDISLEEMASASEDVQVDADDEESDDDDGTPEGAAAQEGPPPDPPEVGTIMRGRIGSVSESGTIAIVNRIIDRQAAKAKIEQAREARTRVSGLVFGFNRGGFDVLVEGIRVFCPANGMSLAAISNPLEFVGQRLDFSLPQRKGKSKGIVVSRRAILEREARKHRRERLKELDSGMVVDATVTQVKEFGLFADVGHGLEGLVHQSELNWSHGTRPADVAKPGDTIKVKVLDIKKEGKRLRDVRISLSLKALLPDPWDAAKDTVKPGAVIEGRVTNTTDFGAFVQLADGIEGLLHVNELGKNLKHASQVINIGDPVTVVVDRMDQKQRRISLSKLTDEEQKAVAEGTFNPSERPKSLKPGSHIKVVVDRVEHSGVQVRVKGVLGRKARGFIHSRDLGSWGSGEKRRGLDSGVELDVKVVGTDRSGGLKLSVKGFENDAEREAVREYRKEASKQGFGTFGDLLRAKLESGSDS